MTMCVDMAIVNDVGVAGWPGITSPAAKLPCSGAGEMEYDTRQGRQMNTVLRSAAAVLLLVAAFSSGCASASSSGLHPTPPGLGRLPFSDADVEFMSGMIPHHAQAVIMAGWSPSHGARQDVAILCERIVVGQRDEIAMMQTWLADRGQEGPDAPSTRHKMKMEGMTHEMLMPGMLTDEQMAQLDRARGPEFDRLFLIGMIGHHQGAI